MELNAAKYRIGNHACENAQLHAVYFVSGTTFPLAYSQTERILVVHVNCKLRWNEQTDPVRVKAAKVLWFAARYLHTTRQTALLPGHGKATHVLRHPRMVLHPATSHVADA
jgi:hypothetical protein